METDERNSFEREREQKGRAKPNILLLGLMGAGKTTVGELLARHLGFGFVDVDQLIMKKTQKTIAQIFAQDGENGFRALEAQIIAGLSAIRNHVISVGGGAVADDQNWECLNQISTSIWLKTPPVEISRRIVMNPDEIRNRPLLGDLVNIENKMERQKAIEERLSELEKQRGALYARSTLTVEHAYATPETCAHFIKERLLKSQLI